MKALSYSLFLLAAIFTLDAARLSAQASGAAAVDAGHYLVCYPSSRGGCMESYPELSGPAAILGLIGGTVNRRFEARVGVGGAAYAADGTRVGAVVSQVDAAAFPVTHVGLIIGARWIVVPRYRADRLSMLPWTIGMRVR